MCTVKNELETRVFVSSQASDSEIDSVQAYTALVWGERMRDR